MRTAVEALVWAHGSGPEEARRIAQAFVVEHRRAIQVGGFLLRGRVACVMLGRMRSMRAVCFCPVAGYVRGGQQGGPVVAAVLPDVLGCMWQVWTSAG